MQLTIRLKKRWIHTVLAESEAVSTQLPWQRKRQKPESRTERRSGRPKPRLVRL